jgi:hypothetical protein
MIILQIFFWVFIATMALLSGFITIGLIILLGSYNKNRVKYIVKAINERKKDSQLP